MPDKFNSMQQVTLVPVKVAEARDLWKRLEDFSVADFKRFSRLGVIEARLCLVFFEHETGIRG